MSPNLPRILADLRRYDVRLEIISNGTLMKERKILHELVERAGHVHVLDRRRDAGDLQPDPARGRLRRR